MTTPSTASPLRVLVLANLLVALLMIVLGQFVLSTSRDSFQQRALEVAAGVARNLDQSIAAEVDRADVALRSVARTHQRREAVSPQALLQELRELLRASGGLGIADAQGRALAQVDAPPADLAALVAQARDAPGLVLSEPREAEGGRWVLLLVRPLVAADGRFDGAVYASLPVERVQRLLAAAELGSRGAASVRTARLALVARHAADAPGSMAGLGTANVSAQLREVLARAPAEGRYIAPTALDRIERANAYRRVGTLPLVVIVGLATDDFLAPWRREVVVVVLLAGLAMAVLAAGSVMLLRAWRREARARAALEDEVQLQNALMQTASDGIHLLDREGRVQHASQSFAAMLGYTPDELMGRYHGDWDPRYCEPERAARFRAFEIGGRYRFTTRHRRKDGSFIDVEVVSVGLRTGGRDLLYCASRDVSERERATRQLRARESLLDRIGRVARIGGWEFDLESRELTWSTQMRRIADVPDDHRPVPEDNARYYVGDAGATLAAAVREATQHGTPWDLELPIVTATGRARWVRTVGELERDATGRPARLVGAVQDVTERRQRAAELAREREMREQTERHAAELDALLRERSEMLDVLAHEVRQPLNNASAALQSLAHALPEPADDAALSRLGRAQTVMAQVMANIDNTLAAAALLARTDPIAREDADVDTLIAVVVADMPAAERARIVVQRCTQTRTAAMDMSLMRLALRNLLSNALKFSPPDEPVQVAVADSDDPLALILDVSDRGAGIDDELLPRLFERGARSQRPGTPPGHGLGLYIVRRVMELHGGRVELVRNGHWGATLRLLIVQAPD